jgi:hypothetical protein
LLSASSCVCCATLPEADAAEGVEDVSGADPAEESCELEALCALAVTEAELFVADGAEEEIELDGNAAVFDALKSPAACAVVPADSVWEEGVKLSCDNGDVATSREVLPAPAEDELWFCCVEGWSTAPPFKLATFVRDMITSTLPQSRSAKRCQCATRKPQHVNGERGKGSHSMPEASIDGIDR